MDPSKLHPSLAAAVTSKSFDQPTVPVIVQRSPGPVAHGDVGVMSELEPFHEFVLLPASAVNVEPAMIAALTQDPSVVMIWPDLPVHTWLDDAVPIVRAPRVWETSFTGRGVRIAVLDTGIDPGHPDFEGRIVAYRDFLTQGTGASTATEPAPEVGAASAGAAGAAGLAGTTGPAGSTGPAGTTGPVGAVGRASEMTDPNGHGTHVAGIAAGSGAGSDGLYRGVAPEADLVIARVLDASGNGRTSDVMAGLEWALGQSAQVVNVSLGGPPYPGDGTDAFSLLVNAAVDAGAVVCVAAGNLGPAAGTIGSPAAASAAITVGASVSDPGTAGDEVAQFSSRGPTGDGRQKPDLLFPGVSIAAPRSAGTALGRPVDSLYTALDGTSQATPMASGSAALLLQANPRLSPDEIKSRMRRGARLLPGVPDTAQGAGRGDAYNTFVAAEGSPLEGGAGDGGGDGGGGGGDGGGGGGDGGGGGGEGRDGEPEGADPDPSPARGGCLAAIAAALRGR